MTTLKKQSRPRKRRYNKKKASWVPACDECWARAYGIARAAGRHQVEVYRELIAANPEHQDGAGDEDA